MLIHPDIVHIFRWVFFINQLPCHLDRWLQKAVNGTTLKNCFFYDINKIKYLYYYAHTVTLNIYDLFWQHLKSKQTKYKICVLAGLVYVLIIKLARGSLMLITFGQLNTLHFKVGWWSGGTRGMEPGPAFQCSGLCSDSIFMPFGS